MLALADVPAQLQMFVPMASKKLYCKTPELSHLLQRTNERTSRTRRFCVWVSGIRQNLELLKGFKGNLIFVERREEGTECATCEKKEARRGSLQPVA